MKTLRFVIVFTLYSYLASAGASPSTEIDIGYDSRYVTEGRNNLPNGGIIWSTITKEISEQFILSGAYGLASHKRANYDELNLAVIYQGNMSAMEYSLSVTHLAFLKDAQFDNELALSVQWVEMPLLIPNVDVIYSTQAKGYFVEFGLSAPINFHSSVSVTPYLKLALDYGYAANHAGYNHVTFGVNLELLISYALRVKLIAEHTAGGNIIALQGNTSRQQSWAGMHFIAQF
ncbi:hypothetical protein FX988_03524 [Paraglaciecola mesophila]|uniref:Outer membrane protein beta-barrel domain-containing protein n=1 Tax=Paraglaciecola mesophila TaxID=197222 RepID=A0A857JN09_9ALTE|nr:hypothetical protein [Paraglaciecola mesophila]QHJ13263.1 hypothetical protein FX988_03524 [Paraglaciecola mesophila]